MRSQFALRIVGRGHSAPPAPRCTWVLPAGIRVDPARLRQAALEIGQDADRLRAIGDEVMRATQSAPGYDGEFGPKVHSIGMEGHARLRAEADRLTELSQHLLRKAEAFEAADAQAVAGLSTVGQTLRSWRVAGSLLLAGMGLSWAEWRKGLSIDGAEDEPPPPGLQWLLGFLRDLWGGLFAGSAAAAATAFILAFSA